MTPHSLPSTPTTSPLPSLPPNQGSLRKTRALPLLKLPEPGARSHQTLPLLPVARTSPTLSPPWDAPTPFPSPRQPDSVRDETSPRRRKSSHPNKVTPSVRKERRWAEQQERLLAERARDKADHRATMARLHRNGLKGLLDDHGSDMAQPLPQEVVGLWHDHLYRTGATQLCFFLTESPSSIEAFGLTGERSCAMATLRRLVHPDRVPPMPDWSARLAVQVCLLQEGLCPLEPGPMAVWLQAVRATLLRPTADTPSAADLDLLLRLLATITRLEAFTAHGWLGQQPDALALRHAVTDLMRMLPDILGRCPAITAQERAHLARMAQEVRL